MPATVIPFASYLCKVPPIKPISPYPYVIPCLHRGCRTIAEGRTKDEAKDVLELHLVTVHQDEWGGAA